MRRVPEWFEQVAGGLSDGKDWVAREFRELPLVFRASGWVVLQAFLFKVQPYFWDGLVEIAEVIVGLTELTVRTQLLLAVLLLLSSHIVFVIPKLNRLHNIVTNMDSDSKQSAEPLADGGPPTRHQGNDELSPSGAGAVVGVVAGGAVGTLWGPATIIGLAVLGAMVGDEWEQRVLNS